MDRVISRRSRSRARLADYRADASRFVSRQLLPYFVEDRTRLTVPDACNFTPLRAHLGLLAYSARILRRLFSQPIATPRDVSIPYRERDSISFSTVESTVLFDAFLQALLSFRSFIYKLYIL